MGDVDLVEECRGLSSKIGFDRPHMVLTARQVEDYLNELATQEDLAVYSGLYCVAVRGQLVLWPDRDRLPEAMTDVELSASRARLAALNWIEVAECQGLCWFGLLGGKYDA